MTAPLLRGIALGKRFGLDTALRDASIELASGETVAVRGASGSGKSTLMQCLAGITVPDHGEVHFDGSRVDRMGAPERAALRRRAFGFVFQFGELIPELTATANVMLPLLFDGTPRPEATERARHWLARVGMEPSRAKRPTELSGGQRQRVAIAQALVHEPRILFADEPTGALDSLAGEQVMELIARESSDRGMAVLLVTHDARVAAYAEREINIVDGRCGAPAAVAQ